MKDDLDFLTEMEEPQKDVGISHLLTPQNQTKQIIVDNFNGVTDDHSHPKSLSPISQTRNLNPNMAQFFAPNKPNNFVTF